MDDGLLMKGLCLVIPADLQWHYLKQLLKGHLSASNVQENVKQYLYLSGIK